MVSEIKMEDLEKNIFSKLAVDITRLRNYALGIKKLLNSNKGIYKTIIF